MQQPFDETPNTTFAYTIIKESYVDFIASLVEELRDEKLKQILE